MTISSNALLRISQALIGLTLLSSALVAEAGAYQMEVEKQEICQDFGQKAANAFSARKKGVPKTKVLNYYKAWLDREGIDGEMTRRVLDFGYDNARSAQEAGRRGWAICQDMLDEAVEKRMSQ